MRTIMSLAAAVLLTHSASANKLPTGLASLVAQEAVPTKGSFTPAAGIQYDKDLKCEACIRGGYDFCIWRTFPTDLIHDQYTTCSKEFQNPPVHNVTTVEETKRWVCGRAFKDEVNSLINVCAPYVKAKRDPACGDYLVDLTADNSVATKTIAQLPLYTSCTYRVHTKCGYPGALYVGDKSINGQFDLIWGTFDGVDLDTDINQWEFPDLTSQGKSFASSGAIGSSHIFQNGLKLSDATFKSCDSKDRNLYLTVTRTAVTTPEVETEARQLQDGDTLSNLVLTFYSHQGTLNGSFITLSAMAAIALSVMAMLF